MLLFSPVLMSVRYTSSHGEVRVNEEVPSREGRRERQLRHTLHPLRLGLSTPSVSGEICPFRRRQRPLRTLFTFELGRSMPNQKKKKKRWIELFN